MFRELFTEGTNTHSGDYSLKYLIDTAEKALDSISNGCLNGAYKKIVTKGNKVSISFSNTNDLDEFEDAILGGDCKNAENINKIINEIGAKVYTKNNTFFIEM